MRRACIFVLALITAACGQGAAGNAGGSNANIATVTPAPEKAAGTPQTVTIDSPDGVKLVGSYYEAGKPMTPALLLLHQWQSDRHSFDEFAKRMQAADFNVLAIDGRGFGESTKKADGSTVAAGRTDTDVKAMIGDVGAAFDYLAKQKNVDPKRIGIVGASYGSSLAIIYAADHPEVAAVALLSPGLNYFGNMKTEPAIKKYGERPICLVAADDDKESASAVRSLKAAGGSNIYNMNEIFKKGGHGTALFDVVGDWESPSGHALSDLLEAFFVKAPRLMYVRT